MQNVDFAVEIVLSRKRGGMTWQSGRPGAGSAAGEILVAMAAEYGCYGHGMRLPWPRDVFAMTIKCDCHGR